MNFTPQVPGVAPMSYGQGYGNWQQYAGYNKDNPFGGMPTQQPVAPPTASEPYVPNVAMQQPDYSLPVPPTGLGAAPSMNQGLALPILQQPTLEDSVDKYYGVKR
jgi:hypothetical protein